MKILFIGDVVGSPGRNIVNQHLKRLKEEYAIDFVIVNGENAAHGKGITSRIYRNFIDLGIDVITMGNHTFSKGEILTEINNLDKLVRPINLEPLAIGNFYKIIEYKGKKIAIVNVCGQIFMDRISESPFTAFEKILETIDADAYFVDFHGEATSEKIVFAQYFKKQCLAVVGTHTHVQTADEQIIDGCAFISDVGMCGVYRSVLGRDLNEVIQNMVHKQYTRYTIAKGEAMLSAVIIDVDDESLRANAIKRIMIKPE